MFKLIKLNTYWLNKAKIVAVILILMFNMPIDKANAALGYNDIAAFTNIRQETGQDLFLITGSDSFINVNVPIERQEIITVILTAYSSTIDQTDDTPFITASNTYVRDGIVAANFLTFGTKIKIPSLFGDKVFTVEDRMARKNSDKIDIWFPERHLAKQFGVQEAEVVILE